MSAFGKRLFEYLEDTELRVKFLGKTHYGHIHYKKTYADECITINVWSAIAVVVVHEAIHAMYPKWSESRVRREEHYFMSLLSVDEIKALAHWVLEHK